jgi:hypothetical protein
MRPSRPRLNLTAIVAFVFVLLLGLFVVTLTRIPPHPSFRDRAHAPALNEYHAADGSDDVSAHADANVLPFVQPAATVPTASVNQASTQGAASSSPPRPVQSQALFSTPQPGPSMAYFAPTTPTISPRTLHDRFHARFALSVRPDQAMCYNSFDYGMFDLWNKQAMPMCNPRSSSDPSRATSITCRKWVNPRLPQPTGPHVVCDAKNLVIDFRKLSPVPCCKYRPGYVLLRVH